MPQGDPKTFAPPESVPDSVVYDIFADLATRLDGEYIYLERHANTQEEKEQWRARSFGLGREQRAVDPDDRTALVEHINRWQIELDELRQR